jgi:hypothetical protein
MPEPFNYSVVKDKMGWTDQCSIGQENYTILGLKKKAN